MHATERTGIRFVLTNCADPARRKDFDDWYDLYAANILFPGLLVNCYRFHNPGAAGTDEDPGFAAIYDFVATDLASAWSRTEHDARYPKKLFGDPRSELVQAPLRGTYALSSSRGTAAGDLRLTGITLLMSDGELDASRADWGNALVDTGLVTAASRFRLVEGEPSPARWLEVFETGDADPGAAFARAVELVGPGPAGGLAERYRASFLFHSVLGAPEKMGAYGMAAE